MGKRIDKGKGEKGVAPAPHGAKCNRRSEETSMNNSNYHIWF